MKNLTFSLKALCIVLVIAVASISCQKSVGDTPAGSTGVSLFLTDDPSLVFDNIFIDIQKIEIKAEDNDEAEHERSHSHETDEDDDHGNTSGGWITLNTRPGVYDILHFRNGLDTLFSAGSFPTARTLKKA